MISAGRLNKPATLLSNTPRRDEYGDKATGWVKGVTIWGRWVERKITQSVKAGQRESRVVGDHAESIFSIRPRKISVEDALLIDGEVFRVEAIEVKSHKMELTLTSTGKDINESLCC